MADDKQPIWKKDSDYGSVPDIHVTAQDEKRTFLQKVFPSGFKQEVIGLGKLAWPLLLTSLANAMLPTVALLFCGQLGANQLGAVSLANSVINVTCLAVGMGLATACDTLFSQSYGSENKKRVGMYLQKALFVLTLACFPCWAIHLNTETLLRLIGQDEEIARLAGRYLLFYAPAVLLNFLYQCLSKYIQNQNIVLPSVIIGLLGNGINALLHWVLVYKLNFGTDGSALAQVGANLSFFVFTLGYILISRCYKETWGGWTWDCLQGWGAFMKLAVPGMLMVCLEWWCFEIGTLLSGVMSPTDLGAQSVLFYMEGITFQIPIGVSIACSIRIGQFLGSGMADEAKTSSRVAFVLVSIGAAIVATLYVTLRNYIPRAFSQDPAVIERAAEVFPILAAFCLFEALAGCAGGILRGCGRQTVGAVVIFVGYYLIGLPIGIPLLILTPLKVLGLWIGYAVGVFVQAMGFLFLVGTTNWELEAEEAAARAANTGDETVEGDNSSIVEEVEEEMVQEEEKGTVTAISAVTMPPPQVSPGKRRSSTTSSTGSHNLAPPKAGSSAYRRSPSRSPTRPAARRGSMPVGSLSGDVPGGARRYSQSNIISTLHGRRFSVQPEPAVRYQVPTPERRFSTKYTSQIQKDILARLEAQQKEASIRKLICVRLAILAACILLLVGALALRFLVKVPYNAKELCIPWPQGNATLPTGVTLPPFCNETTGAPVGAAAVGVDIRAFVLS